MEGGLIAGVDEVGRGCLAGPVVAAAVILPQGFTHPLLRDSKSLTPGQREVAAELIFTHALAVSFGFQGPAEIDRLNILQASLCAMQEAIETLPLRPDWIRVDGPHKPFAAPHIEACVQGDARYPEIAAASIVAKVVRDKLMALLHREFPQYGWVSNKGYPTRAHWAALVQYGPSPLHRRTFLQGKLPF